MGEEGEETKEKEDVLGDFFEEVAKAEKECVKAVSYTHLTLPTNREV